MLDKLFRLSSWEMKCNARLAPKIDQKTKMLGDIINIQINVVNKSL